MRSTQGSPVYQKITLMCRQNGLQEFQSFTAQWVLELKHQLKEKHLFELSKDDPIVIDIIDYEENLRKIIPNIQNILKEGLITMQDVFCHPYRG